MKRWNELTPEQKLNVRRFVTYLYDEGDNGFDADWDAWVIETYQEYDYNLERTLQDIEQKSWSEAQAVIHSWQANQE